MATLGRMMKKAAASSVIPLASRTICPYRNYTTPLKNSITMSTSNSITNLFGKVFRATSIPAHHHFSSLAKKRSNTDDTFLSVIQSEIDAAKQRLDDLEVEDAPIRFPFEIEDNAGEQIVTLTRKYQGEEIKLIVRMPDISRERIDDEEDDQDDQETDQDSDKEDDNQDDQDDEEMDEESDRLQDVQMVVSVTKKNGPILEFDVVANTDGAMITGMAVKNPDTSNEDIAYEGPKFWNLDESMQEAFHTYLEVRGIKPSTTKFLLDYMASKEQKEYTRWLKNLKKFVAR